MHHIIVRGIERRKIFRSDVDRRGFIDRLATLITETGTQCLAWALIPNHVHLLLRSSEVPIASVMQRLLTGYAVSFNRNYRRHGPLFQNRYKSILCQEDKYLKELVRYIHLNPLRARLVEGGLIRSVGGWDTVKKLRKAGVRLKGDERVLGDSDFVEAMLAGANEQLARHTRLRSLGLDFEKVVSRVAELLNVVESTVLTRDKTPKSVLARRLICHFAHNDLGLTTIDIARRLGLNQSVVSRAARLGRVIANEEGYTLQGEAKNGHRI